MITLAFDSTAKIASVAVLDGERALATYNIDNGLTQSELLLPMAEGMLRALRLSFDDIDLLTCTTGPGSFTGVRIGVSLIKGIALGKNIPCVEVSTLEALAENLVSLRGIIVPVMDARRGQFYTALFESDGCGIKRLSDDCALNAAALKEMLSPYSDIPVYLVGDGYFPAKRALSELGVKTEETPPLLIAENAYSCARVALRKFDAKEFVSDKDIKPSYLRLPQAERERLERENAASKEIKQ